MDAHSFMWGRAPAAASEQDSEVGSHRDGEVSHFFPASGHRHLKAPVNHN